MINIELVAKLKMLNLQSFVTTPSNYRFLLSSEHKEIIYISRYDNTYMISTPTRKYSDENKIDITNMTLPLLIEGLDEKKNK